MRKPLSGKTISFDLDDSFFPTRYGIADLLRREHGIVRDPEQCFASQLNQDFSSPFVDGLYSVVCLGSAYIQHLTPSPEAVAAIRKLTEFGADLVATTYRVHQHLPQAFVLLQSYGVSAELNATNGHKISKRQLLQQSGAEYHFDDCIKTLKDIDGSLQHPVHLSHAPGEWRLSMHWRDVSDYVMDTQ